MEENDRLQKQVSQLVYENSFFRQQTQNVILNTPLSKHKFTLYDIFILDLLAVCLPIACN